MDIKSIKKKFTLSTKGLGNIVKKPQKVRVPLRNAPISLQKQWKKMSVPLKGINRILKPDFDRDGVPNRWDCRPMNPFKQDSQIYLNPTKLRIPKKKKHIENRIKTSIFREQTSGTGGYVMPAVFPKKIFFGSGFRKVDFRKPENIKYLAKVIEHEETHHALHKIDKKRESPDEISDSSKAFDDIVIPSVKKSQFTEGKPEEWGEIINPHSALEIEPEAAKELGLQTYEDDKPIFKTYEEIYKYEQERENPSIVYLEDEGVSVEKQEEWQDMTEMEKDVERITEPDTDGDLVPDEYDEDPEDDNVK